MEYGNTTRQEKHIPSGLGFTLIRDFLKMNKGRIQIVSANGFWEESSKAIQSKELPFLKGTAINMEFKLAEKRYYYMTSKVRENEIF